MTENYWAGFVVGKSGNKTTSTIERGQNNFSLTYSMQILIKQEGQNEKKSHKAIIWTQFYPAQSQLVLFIYVFSLELEDKTW